MTPGTLDEVFVTIQGTQQYLWRAVDQDGDTIDILVQRRRNTEAAVRFFRQLLNGQGREPPWMMTDKLKSYDAAHRTVMPSVEHLNHLTRITAPTSRINRLGNKKIICAASLPQLKLNGF